MNKKQRLIVLLAAFLMSLCFGAGYAWSVFAQELHKNYAFHMRDAQMVFGLFQVFFAMGFIAGGRLIKKTGPGRLAFLGGIIMGLGFFSAGMFEPSPVILFIAVGFFGGGGAGLAYICPLETVQKCFPDKKALVTGLSVSGLGIGAFLIALGADYLIKSGVRITDIFKYAGGLFLPLICLLAFFLRTPGADGCKEEEIEPLKYKEILSSRKFWALFAAMSTSLFAGLMVIGNMKPLGMKWGIAETTATAGVSVLALSNSGGRMAWGYITHKIGEVKGIYISIIFQAVVLFLAAFLINNTFLFFLFAVLSGLNYGCALVVYASSVSRYFGIERLGQIYPLIFASNFISGLTAPSFGGFIFDKTGSYSYALLFASGILIMGAVIFSILFKDPGKPAQSV